jgi:UDP-2,3-diacylglucosamine pyrophosphatase LpxH
MKKGLVLSDQHIPYHAKRINDLILEEFIPEFKPDYIDLLGDMIDFWQISKFRKDPARKNDIQKDIDTAVEYLTKLREVAPQAEIILHYGNHLGRLRKYIWDRAAEISSLRSLNLKWLLDCDKLHLKVIEQEEGYDIRGKLVLTHGTLISQDSAMTAKRNLQRYGQSIICGHTHRLGSTYKTDLRGTIGAWENGCLCNLDLVHEWGAELANWQQGFSIVFYNECKDKRFLVQQIPIIQETFMVGERCYECGKKDMPVVSNGK